MPVAGLWLISLGYRLGLFLRGLLCRGIVKASCPVISVGNLTVGGTGKTPVVIMLAEFLAERKKIVAIVSSGYGRTSAENIIAVGHAIRQRSVAEVGDEVMMMAERLPRVLFAVGKSKSEMALKLRDRQPDVIIVDDGYQHRRLYRDVNILLLDAERDLRSEALFPLGRLREPIKAIARADCVILNRKSAGYGRSVVQEWLEAAYPDLQVSEIRRLNENIISQQLIKPLTDIKEKRYYILAGIGDGAAFAETLTARLGQPLRVRLFPDHCAYTDADLGKIREDVEQVHPDYLLTTHKDYVKLRGFDFGAEMYYVDLTLKFESGRVDFFELVRGKIER
ncbi:MAG: tetraacyldisaccharide 4'-kinase [candidate division Zixibacteria bacterium]|nr:tetraacyldisaccharide 4'-kinase [candidate division Zixibacteria bacterium]